MFTVYQSILDIVLYIYAINYITVLRYTIPIYYYITVSCCTSIYNFQEYQETRLLSRFASCGWSHQTPATMKDLVDFGD